MKKDPLRFLIVLATAALLAACDSRSESGSANSLGRTPLPASVGPAIEASSVKLAYKHFLGLEMPPSSVEPRYTKARDACLQDTQLNCTLVNASFNMGNPIDAIMPSATLSVRLPHDQVAVFEQNLMAALAGEVAGDNFLATQSTSAEDLTKAIMDADRREAQLTDYRDRLTVLSKRADAKAEDLVKIEGELSSVQSQLEMLAGQKKGLNDRVSTEVLDIRLEAR